MLFSFIAYVMSGKHLERIVSPYFITPVLFYAKMIGALSFVSCSYTFRGQPKDWGK